MSTPGSPVNRAKGQSIWSVRGASRKHYASVKALGRARCSNRPSGSTLRTIRPRSGSDIWVYGKCRYFFSARSSQMKDSLLPYSVW